MKKALLHSMVILGVMEYGWLWFRVIHMILRWKIEHPQSYELKDSITFMYSEESLAHEIWH